MNALTTTGNDGRLAFDLMNPGTFQHIQRVANMYANSPLFPEHLRKGGVNQAVANAVLVMNIADRLREDPLTVAQNIYFVGGKPGWSAAYMIAKANQHGVFKTAIDWKIKGEGADLSVTAFAKMKDTGREVSFTITMADAKADGWTKNSKYQSMPERMLRYRTATALIRLYCPEVMVGIPRTSGEIEDEIAHEQAMRDITPADETADEPSEANGAADDTVDVEVDDAPDAVEEPKKVDRTPPAPAKVEPAAEPAPKKSAKPKTAPKQDAAPPAEGEPAQEQEPAPAASEATTDYEGIAETILKDLKEFGPENVRSLYGSILTKMETEAPQHFAHLSTEIDLAERNRQAEVGTDD